VCIQEVKHKGFLLVSTDIASRGFDLTQTTHIYNFDLPKTAIDYLHRAGRTGRNPLLKELCTVTTFITEKERFVLRRFENELKFQCEQLTSL
jgi:superfamily II DNA/RNA helicase